MHFKKVLFKFDTLGLILPVFILVLWSLLPLIYQIPHYQLPSIIDCFFVSIDYLFGNLHLTSYSGQFIMHSSYSLLRVLSGFIVAGLLGVPFGILSGYYPLINRTVSPFIHFLRMIPGIAWLPLTLLWFGTGSKSTQFLISLAAFFPIYVNTVLAVKEIPKEYLDEAKLICIHERQILLKIIVPLSLNTILTGLRLGLGLCWAYLVLGEMTGVNYGIGAVMMDARMLGNIDIVLVSMITIAIWGKLTDVLLQFIATLLLNNDYL